MVQNASNSTYWLAVTKGDEIVGFSVFKKGILLLVKELQPFKIQPGNPIGIILIDCPGHFDECLQLFLGFNLNNFDPHLPS
jgi:hypothetical protein